MGRQKISTWAQENGVHTKTAMTWLDVVTSMCARIYGRRAAKNRARRALQAAGADQ